MPALHATSNGPRKGQLQALHAPPLQICALCRRSTSPPKLSYTRHYRCGSAAAHLIRVIESQPGRGQPYVLEMAILVRACCNIQERPTPHAPSTKHIRPSSVQSVQLFLQLATCAPQTVASFCCSAYGAFPYFFITSPSLPSELSVPGGKPQN